MNSYSELLRYIKEIGQPLVNTITQGEWAEVDIDKKNIFPLLHLVIGNATFPSDSVITFDVQIGCFDIRDINKEVNTDKFYGNDNEIDNLNSTLEKLNRVWLLMLRDFEDNNIIASDTPSIEQFTESRNNLIDGWIMTFQVDMPNTTINLCQ